MCRVFGTKVELERIPMDIFGPAGLRVDALPGLNSYTVPKPTGFAATAACIALVRAGVHQGLDGHRSGEVADARTPPQPASFQNYAWKSHCNGAFQLPIAARRRIPCRANDSAILPNDYLMIPDERGGCIVWHVLPRSALRCRTEAALGNPRRSPVLTV